MCSLGALLATTVAVVRAADEPAWLMATAQAVPKETTNQGSGYFSIVAGKNGRLYIGTAKYGIGSFLVEFDPTEKKMAVVCDTHKAIGTTATGFAAQSKVHTRNNVGASGKIFFGTKQGYPDEAKGEKREDYPGGHPLVYDPATGVTKVYPNPVPHQGIISITPDESRGIAYVSTCRDSTPDESSHFMILDLNTGKYRDLMDCAHAYAFIVIDHKGRAYHPIRGGDIARYDPVTDNVERLKQTIDGEPPAKDTFLALPETYLINWDIAPDGKTLYALPLSGNRLYAYDLTAEGDTLPGRTVGSLLWGYQSISCYAMCVGPGGDVWAAVTGDKPGVQNRLHLFRYRPGEKEPRNLGPIAIANPDYTEFLDKDGKPLPAHGGFHTEPDGKMTSHFVVLGICQGLDGAVYVMALSPYTILQLRPPLE
jgi:sugar lactone lactonase YvrE